MDLIALVKALEIGRPGCTTLYLRIPAALRQRLGVSNGDLFFCYFNKEPKTITYVPKAQVKEV